MPKLIGKLNSIVLAVKNMDKSLKFYRDVLGMKVEEKSAEWSELKAGNFYIGLYRGKPDRPSGGMLPVFEVQDIQKTARELKKRKVKFVDDPYEEDFGFLAIFQDPDGYCYELFQEK
jgi:catechol 2,3-dioxygenase-like lactoylglutathione lyase family enzyme